MAIFLSGTFLRRTIRTRCMRSTHAIPERRHSSFAVTCYMHSLANASKPENAWATSDTWSSAEEERKKKQTNLPHIQCNTTQLWPSTSRKRSPFYWELPGSSGASHRNEIGNIDWKRKCHTRRQARRASYTACVALSWLSSRSTRWPETGAWTHTHTQA